MRPAKVRGKSGEGKEVEDLLRHWITGVLDIVIVFVADDVLGS